MDLAAPTIYYIDDDEEDLMFFEKAVKHLANDVRLFPVSADFLNSTNVPQLPAIIFLDLNMPQFTGFQVLEFIRKKSPYKDIPVVILSTSSDYRSIETSWELGANLFITKSGDFPKLVQSLKDTIAIDWNIRVRDKNLFVYNFNNSFRG